MKMTVKALSEKLGLEPVAMSDDTREVTGGYTGDLLSWVMGKAQSGQVWVTIMTNINIVAVAMLTDVAAIILAENVQCEQDVINAALSKDINIYRSKQGAFELCAEISGLL